jgi:hypothetical protein
MTMKNALLATFSLFVILSQVACSDDSPAASYAAANNCTIAGVGAPPAPAAGAAAAAQAQVPCSLQNGSAIAAQAGLPNPAAVAQAPVPPGTGVAVTQGAKINAAVLAQNSKVQAQLAALNAAEPPPAVKAESIDTASVRAPASVAPSEAPPAIEGQGDIIR